MPERYTRRRMTDRRDGRRLRTISPIFQLSPFTMLSPADAAVGFSDAADVSALETWLRARRAAGDDGVSLIHIVIAAYVRTLALYPALNRFVAGRFIYARDAIDIVLPAGGAAADMGSMAVTVRFQATDTVYDVYRKINTRLDNLKADQSADRLERLAATLVKTPRFILRFGIAVLRWMDYHGWLRPSLAGKSPYHGSAVISDDGASHLPPLFRGINSTGALPVSVSVGRIRAVTELDKAGQPHDRKLMDFAVTYDSRIVDSAYMGAAFRYFRYFLSNPDTLENPPERVNEDAL